MNLHYLENQFDNVTKTSFRKMLTITNDHVPRLQAQQADPDILTLLTRTTIVHDLYLKAYSDWKSAQGFYKGATLSIDGLLDKLSGKKARNWDTGIMVAFDKGTSEHAALLPNGHAPFQQGTMDERIAAVKTLAQNLLAFLPLAALQVDVLAYHAQLKLIRDGQQNKEQLTDQTSSDLESARIAIAIMMYRNMGSLMDKFGDDPTQITNYFEIALIQRHTSDTDTGTELNGNVAASSTVNIAELTPEINTVVLSNTGAVPLTFCLAATAAGSCAIGITLNAGESQVVTPDLLGDPVNLFLNVTNTDPIAEGSYSVELA